jgi:type I restriction enzyme S subunit
MNPGHLSNLERAWPDVTLGDKRFFAWGSGLWTGKTPPYSIVGVIRNTNFTNDGRLDFSDVARLEVESRRLPAKQLMPGDIVLERSGGGPKQPVGRVALFDKPDGLYSFSNFTARLRIQDQEEFDPRFVHLFLLHFHSTGGTLTLQQNTTGIRNLRFSDYLRTLVPKPPLVEQRAIASVISSIRSVIDGEDGHIALLRELKASTMDRCFREALRGESLQQTELGEFPVTWDICRLGTICEIKSGGTPSRDVPEYWGGSVPWVKTSEIKYGLIKATEESITEKGLASSSARVFPPGTLLMAMYGQGVTRGKVAILGIPAATNQACAAFFPDESRLHPAFLYALLEHYYERVRSLGHGANQKNLSGEILKAMSIAVPRDLGEQLEIARIVATYDERLAIRERRRGVLRELFNATLSKLMTGKLRVTPLLELQPNAYA